MVNSRLDKQSFGLSYIVDNIYIEIFYKNDYFSGTYDS
jgi:hypothetical protein